MTEMMIKVDFTTTLVAYMSPKNAAKAFLEKAEREQKKQQKIKRKYSIY